MSPRARLAALAAAAGYPTATLDLIVEATLPRHPAGERLRDAQLEQVTSAVEVLAQAGRSAASIEVLTAEYRRADGERWRERFWERAVRTAAVRHSHPELYGRSPCEPAAESSHPSTTGDPITNTTAATVNGERCSSSASELAALIDVPRRLPLRYDGQPIRHLSNSSYTRFLLCPDDYRRHYLLGQRTPPSGAMFLGSRVDDALTTYYRRILEHGEQLTVEQINDAYRDQWARELAGEQADRGVDWEAELPEPAAFQLGLAAIELTFAELVPKLGRPVAVQRKLEFALAPGLEWSIQCFLDLETERAESDGQLTPAVVDYKVKGSPLSQERADHDPQAGLYLAGRWLEGNPAHELSFAQIAKPGRRRKQISASLITTRRTAGQLRGSLARVAQAASQIAAYYERFGPDQPWGFADPAGWKCSRRYCQHWLACPGGAGL
jgi:hypothetical protein